MLAPNTSRLAIIFVCDQVVAKQLDVRFLSSCDQLADGFSQLTFSLNVHPLPFRLKGRISTMDFYFADCDRICLLYEWL